MLSQLNYNSEWQSQLSIWQAEPKQITLKIAIRRTFFFFAKLCSQFLTNILLLFPPNINV